MPLNVAKTEDGKTCSRPLAFSGGSPSEKVASRKASDKQRIVALFCHGNETGDTGDFIDFNATSARVVGYYTGTTRPSFNR